MKLEDLGDDLRYALLEGALLSKFGALFWELEMLREDLSV